MHCAVTTELLQGVGAVELDSHQHCKEEYGQLREEYERYKLRAQSVLKNKSHKVWPHVCFGVSKQ